MVRRWKSTDPYPQGGTFGELLDWHLWWGTRPEYSKEKKNPRWAFVDFAQAVHLGVPATGSDETPSKKLSYWREDRYLPRNDTIVQNIFEQLFGDDPNLSDWKLDLQNALERDREVRVTPTPKRNVADLGEPSHIPRPTAHFVGRDEDVESLTAALTSDDRQSAVLVQGGPGIGKTELTKAIAHHGKVAKYFGDRRWFIPLENAASADAMGDTIVRAIGGDPRQSFTSAIQSLGDRDTLLILDNLETPWESPDQRQATEQTLANIAAVPGISILASFRGLEAVGGPRWIEHPLEELPRAAATALFASIAGQWVLDETDLDRFVDALGGIPLAIDLVARRAYGRASLTPLWREWGKVGADLAVRPDFDAERLTSLPLSIELSLRSPRLTDPAKRLFRLLGALPAGLAVDDIEGLLGDDAFEATERLCRAGIAIERMSRIDLLPPIREHARRHCRPEGDEADEWVEYFLNLIERLGEKIGSFAGDGALSRLYPEFDNIEAAFREAIARGKLGSMAAALDGFANYHFIGGVDPTILDELAEAFRTKHHMLGTAKCLTILGDYAFQCWNPDGAREPYEEALYLYRQIDNVLGEAHCIKSLAYTHSGDAMQSAFEEALSHCRQIGWVLGEAECTMRLAILAHLRSDYDKAQPAFEEALTLYRKCGYALGEANCLDGLGEIALQSSDRDTARAAFEEALRLYRIVGNTGQAESYSRRLDEF